MSKQIKEELIEEWREYHDYKVSNYGKVINKNGKGLTTKVSGDGYVHTSITDYGGKRIHGMHRVVATVFLPNPNNLPEVNHVDGKKENNKVDNLEWITKEGNQKHEAKFLRKRGGENNYQSILTEKEILTIYDLCKNSTMKYKDMAKLYGVIPQEITRMANATCWRHLGLEPLPPLVRGSRSMGKKVLWINKNKEYTSMSKCSDDLRNTYNIVISNHMIKRICEGELSERKGQQFKFI